MGYYPVIPLLLFGLLPFFLYALSALPFLSLGAVLGEGGTGTEGLDAGQIKHFYQLPEAQRERFLNGEIPEDQ